MLPVLMEIMPLGLRNTLITIYCIPWSSYVYKTTKFLMLIGSSQMNQVLYREFIIGLWQVKTRNERFLF
jgi:hypothetical protein